MNLKTKTKSERRKEAYERYGCFVEGPSKDGKGFVVSFSPEMAKELNLN